jgi:hypothetical protein
VGWLYEIYKYSADRIKELQDSANEQDRRLAPLFDPNNITPWVKLPIILEQWEKDPTSPSGWSYRLHVPLLNSEGIWHLSETYLEGGSKALWDYQSDQWRKENPAVWEDGNPSLGIAGGFRYPSLEKLDGTLFRMPPKAVQNAFGVYPVDESPAGMAAAKERARKANLSVFDLLEELLAEASKGSSRGESVGSSGALPVVIGVASVSAVAAGGYAVWHYWPQIAKWASNLYTPGARK